MYQQQGVISKNKKNSISQKFPNRSFRVIHQNDRILILHVAAHSVFMDIFFNPKFRSGAVCQEYIPTDLRKWTEFLIGKHIYTSLTFCLENKQKCIQS